MAGRAAYLPPHLLRTYVAGPPRELPHEERLSGAMLLADVTGFTPLTERLQARGREGAEEIARVMNAVFRPAISAIEAWGGSVAGFGGDSILALFLGPSPVRRARRAALQIAAALRALGRIETGAGTVRLRLSQAIHHGEISGIHLGSPTTRHYLVTGVALARLARLERETPAGAIRLSTAAAGHRRVERKPRRRAGSVPLPSPRWASWYLPHAVMDPATHDGSFRQAAILFLETADRSPERLQLVALALGEALSAHGGLLLKTDVSSAGNRWLCAFGVPRVHEDDGIRAGRAALQVMDSLPRDLPIRGGLAVGVVANLTLGSPERRSFEVMGDTVNVAARLAEAAPWGRVLVLRGHRSLRALTRPRGWLRLRGKGSALPVASLAAPASAPQPSRRSEPAFLGRSAELGVIRRAMEAATARRGSAVAIVGEAGIGKSRLGREVLGRARRFCTIAVRAPSPARRPYESVAALVAAALGDGPPPNLHGVARARALGLTAAEIAHLKEVLEPPRRESGTASTHGDARRLGHCLAVAKLVAILAARRPLLLLLDDADHMDAASVDLLAFLARSTRSQRVLLMLLQRPGGAHPPSFRRLELGELPPSAVHRLVRSILEAASPGAAVPESLVRFVLERAAGNPLYVEELVGHLVEIGDLRRGTRTWRFRRGTREPLSADIEGTIAARLDRLPPAGRSLLQVASVLGRAFDRATLLRVAERKASGKETLDDLVGRGLLVAAGRRVLAFRHALVQETSYASLLGARRRGLHRTVARVMADARPTDQALLGYHWDAGAVPHRARRCYFAAARAALAAHARQDALRLFDAGLALASRPDRSSVAARHLRGRILTSVGRVQEALDEHRQALREARAMRDATREAECHWDIGAALVVTGRHEAAGRTLRRALARCPRRARALRGRIRGTLATLAHETGAGERSIPLYERAIDLLDRAGDPDAHRVRSNMATVYHDLGRSRDAEAAYARGLAIQTRQRQWQHASMNLCNIGLLRVEAGRWAEAESCYRRALVLARRVGARRVEGIVLGNLGNLEHERERPEPARRSYLQALSIAREVEDLRFEGHLLSCLGSLPYNERRFSAARRWFEQALHLHRRTSNKKGQGVALTFLAGCARARGDTGRAWQLCRSAERLLARAGQALELGKCHLELARIARAMGRDPRPSIGRARTIAEASPELARGPLGREIEHLERSIRRERPSTG